jgi:RHS repeat-associated protein
VGQDYAEQRYYDGGKGRFWSPDPGGLATADRSNPTSWNRYGYVGGDPVNFQDSHGLFSSADDGDDWDPSYCDENPMDLGCLPSSAQQGPGPGRAAKTPLVKAYNRLDLALETFEGRENFSPNCEGDIAAIAAAAPSYIDPATITIAGLQAAADMTTYANGVGSTVSQAALYPNSPQAAATVAGKTIGAIFSVRQKNLWVSSGSGSLPSE